MLMMNEKLHRFQKNKQYMLSNYLVEFEIFATVYIIGWSDLKFFKFEYILYFLNFKALNYTVRNVGKCTKFLCYKGYVKFDDIYDVFK